MASTVPLSPISLRAPNAPDAENCSRIMQPRVKCAGRRQILYSLMAATVVTFRESPSMAEDIPLFGIKKKLKKVEEEAVEIAEKGLERAEKGLETAERGIETVEREIVAEEREIAEAVSFGGLAQAGVVAGAEILGVLIATSVVNGILGPEARQS